MSPTFPRQSCFVRSLCLSGSTLTVVACLIGFTAESFALDETAVQTTIAGDLFQLPPETPDRILEAAIITQKLGRQDDARKFLRKLLDQQLGETELRILRERVGAGPFLELSADRKLQPEARELLLAINAASKPQPLSVVQLQELIQALATPGETATSAAVALVANGDNSASALLAADLNTPAGKVADQLLKTYARQMRHGLMKELNLADPAGRSRIVQLLSSTADPDVAIGLLRWQFDPDSDVKNREAAAMAVERLSKGALTASTAAEASEFLTQRSEALMKSAAGRFARFREPAIVNEIKPRDRRAELLREATLYLTDALALDASNSRASSLLLVAKSAVTDPALSAAASFAAAQNVRDLAAALNVAAEIGEAHAGIELLRAMKASDFSTIDAEARELTGDSLKTAVNSPDPRIRFLASDVAINVSHTDISGPAVKRTFTSIRMGSLKPEAVVVDSNDKSLRDLDVALENAGFTVALSQTGQDGFDAAASQMNCELMLVDAESAGWPLATTLANLRSDVRTRNVPIVVIGPNRFADRVSRLSEIYSGIWFLAEPVGIDSLALKLDAMLLPTQLLTPEDRAVMKQLAGEK
ncbi:MAG: hypothetical protein O2856_16645 [Planctomycetota bacterium]|nr:hypothetical protein [Planctomycetota bacterium]